MKVKNIIEHLVSKRRELYKPTAEDELGRANEMGQDMMFKAIMVELSEMEEK